MNKITLYIGLNDKNSKRQELDTIECYKIVSRLIAEYADGGTIYSAQGIYKHANGDIVIENTLRVELIDVVEQALKTIVTLVKNLLNQESVIVQREQIVSEFV